MKICFILPGYSYIPIGGYKLIYQYAIALQKKNINVELVHIEHSDRFPAASGGIKSKLRQTVKKILIDVGLINKLSIKWMNLQNVSCLFLTKFCENKIPKADIYVSTSWQTNLMATEIKKNVNFARFYYFIQGYEIWDTEEKNVIRSWQSADNIILISNYLSEIANRLNLSYNFIPNFFDENEFFVSNKINDRNRMSVLFMYHPSKSKNFGLTLKIIEKLFNKYGRKITLTCFSAYTRPKNMPNYVNFVYNPSRKLLRQLYNDSAIFLSTSDSEGWGMTTMEAMACGCAVISTNNGGINNYARSNHNSIICEIDDEIGLYEELNKLLNINNWRIQIAEQAVFDVKKFTLSKSVSMLLDVFLKPA